MYVYFFSFYSHPIPYESIWTHFLQSDDVFSNISGCVSILTAFCLWDSASMGPSVDPFPWWNQLKKHFVFVQFVWQFVSQPSIFNYLIENCLFIINFHRLRPLRHEKPRGPWEWKLKHLSNSCPNPSTFQRRHRITNLMWSFFQWFWYQFEDVTVARLLRWTGLQWRPSSSPVARALLCSSSTNVGCVQSWATMGSILWT